MYKLLILLASLELAWAEQLVYNSPLLNDSAVMVKAVAKSMFIVVFLLIFMFFWYKRILPNLQGITEQRNLKVVEKLILDPTTTVYLIEVAGNYQVIMSSNKNVANIAQYKASELKLKKATKSAAKPVDFSKVLQDSLKQLASKSTHSLQWLSRKK